MTSQNGADPAAETTQPSKFAVFRHTGYTLLLISRVISVFGNQMLNVAIGWLVYDKTEDPLNLAFVGLAQFVPALALALVTGHVADRFDRRLVVGIAYGVQAVCGGLFVLLILSGLEEIWPMFLILLILGCARAFYMPASQALLPNLVPQDLFPSAVVWSTSSNKFATITGPALGGILYTFGPDVVFGMALAFYTTAMLLVSMIRRTTQVSKREPLTWGALVAGFSYMRIQPIVFGSISMDLFAVLFGGLTALLPIYARDILQIGPEGLGLLRSSPAVGGLIAGLILTQLPPMRRAGLVMFISVAIYGLATIVFAFSEIFVLSVIALATLGAADMVSVFIRLTLIQISTPDHMRGRVSAVNSVFVTASNELGEFRAGVMAAAFGAVASAAVGGFVVLGVTTLWWRLFPALRRADRLDGK